MSNNKDQARINFYQFISQFSDLLKDYPLDAPNKCIFKLFDVKKQGTLTIVLLMQILNNLSRQTYLAQEILLLTKEYKNKNILIRGGHRRQVTLNYGFFAEIIPWSCLV